MPALSLTGCESIGKLLGLCFLCEMKIITVPLGIGASGLDEIMHTESTHMVSYTVSIY